MIRVFITVGALGVAAASAFAQSPSGADSVRCAAALNAPTKDSAFVQYDATFSPYDTTRHVPVYYREILGQGLRQELKLPRPLSVDTYDERGHIPLREPSSKQSAVATLVSYYRLILHRDGRVTDLAAVGGVRNAAFDDAVVGALAMLDSERLLPRGDSIAFDHDTLDVRLTIAPDVTTDTSGTATPVPPGVTPLFRLQLPVRPFERMVTQMPENRAPRYPSTMRARNIEGEVLAQFVVKRDGSVELASVHLLKATRMEFASAVLTALPPMRFSPSQIGGCAVAMLVQMPFVFGLSR